MKITAPWLAHPGTQALCAALEDAGFKALFVGGCVRNALLGMAVSDIDLATDARPEIVSNIAKSAGFKVVPTGIEHGTVTVIAQHLPHEVTTFRRDVATDGRRATVAFASDVTEDAARRDFTMNALYADARGVVQDPLAGLPDLIARRVRFVGDAETRIREDYLRILRFFRFHATHGDPQEGLDAEGLAACALLSAGIETLSCERLGAEMRKLLAAPDPAPALAAMQHSGVLLQVLPGADPRALAPLVHLEHDIPARWLRRLAVLGGEGAGDRLRLSRQETTDLGRIIDEIGGVSLPAALGWKLGAALAQDTVLARAALLESALPPHWQADIARGVATAIPVTAADLMPALKGPALGQRLREIEARWLASDLTLDKRALLS